MDRVDGREELGRNSDDGERQAKRKREKRPDDAHAKPREQVKTLRLVVDLVRSPEQPHAVRRAVIHVVEEVVEDEREECGRERLKPGPAVGAERRMNPDVEGETGAAVERDGGKTRESRRQIRSELSRRVKAHAPSPR